MADPTTPRTRGWFRLLRWVAAVLVVVGLVAAGAILALRSSAGRARLLALARHEVLVATGLQLDARELRLELAPPTVEVLGLSLGRPGAPPILRAARVRAAIVAGPTLHGSPVIRELEIEAPVIDLAAPMPAMAVGTGSGGPASWSIRHLHVTGGRVEGIALPPQAGRFVRAARVEGIEIEGAVSAAAVELALRRAVLRLDRTDPGTDSIVVTGRVAGPLAGPLHVAEMRATGDGVEVEADGDVALAPALRVSADLASWLELARIVPELAAGGTISAQGHLDSGAPSGAFTLSACDVPADGAARFLPADAAERLGLAGTAVDADATVALDGAGVGHARATVGVTWRRGPDTLATAHARLAPRGAGVAADFDAEVLPAEPGIRTAQGRVVADAAASLANGSFVDSAIVWQADDVLAEIDRLRRAWPRAVPTLPDLPLAGAVSLLATLEGPVADPTVEAEASFRPEQGGVVEAAARGRVRAAAGEAELRVANVPLAMLGRGLEGTLAARVNVHGRPGAVSAEATVDAADVRAGGRVPHVDSLHVEAATDGRELSVGRFEARSGERSLSLTGRARVETPLRDASVVLQVERPIPQVRSATAHVRLDHGAVRVEDGVVDAAFGTVLVDGVVPLGALESIAALAPALRNFPVERAPGPVHVELFAPALDSCRIADAFGLAERPERARGDLAADLWLDLAHPAASTGEVRLDALSLDVGGSTVSAEGPLRIVLRGGALDLLPVRLQAPGTQAEARAHVVLDPGWDPQAGAPGALVQRFEVGAKGEFDSAILAPYLFGGSASGTLGFTAEGHGTPRRPEASLVLSGPDVVLSWASPYPTRISDVQAEAGYADGALTLWSSSLRLNDGTVEASGTRDASGRGELEARFEGVRYRLDYGLRVVTSGDIQFTALPGSRPRLGGTVTVTRGVLDRDLDLEREVLPGFLAPVVTSGTESNPLEGIDLDVAVETVDGVRVRNNLADLVARWDRLTVTGTAWTPALRGTVSIDPGGLVFAYGQTIRIDRGDLIFTGDPLTDPRLELSTTGSWQDPSIPRAGEQAGVFAGAAGPAETGSAMLESLSTGIADYYGERIASRIGESLGLGRITLRPVLVFGETDPSARLTVTRDLSRQVSLAVSLDLRNAQRQTYLLDLHDLPFPGSVRGQAFTTDDSRYGGSLQQVIELGGTRAAKAPGPRLRRVVWRVPAEADGRSLRRAVKLRKGDAVPEGAAFDAEVELEETLRRGGWPDPVVTVASRPTEKAGVVDLVVTVEPGLKVEYRFTGDAPPKALRSSITDLYRPGVGEAPSLEDMRRQTLRIVRSEGHVDPQATVRVEGRGTGQPGEAPLVTIDVVAGPRVDLRALRVAGVGDDVSAAVAARFPGVLDRAELAAGLPDADARLLRSLADLGYPQARLLQRHLEPDGTLSVEVAAGAPLRVASVELTGVARDEAGRLEALVPLHAGDPLRLDLVAIGAARMEEDARERGFARAAVKAAVRDQADADPAARIVVYDVSLGRRYDLGAVSFAGVRSARTGLLRRLAALPSHAPFTSRSITAARSRLLRTSLFSTVTAAETLGDDGTAGVVFTVAEKPPLSLAYGVRWESSLGASAVVDVIDRDLIGSGVTAGLRARWEPNDRSGRVYLSLPEALGAGVTIESYAERRRLISGGLVRDTTEGALQVSRALGAGTIARVYARIRDTHLTEVEPDPFFPFDVRVKHPYVGVQLVRDSRDDDLQPGRGVLASLDLSGSASLLGSDFHYLRGYGQLNLYRPVGLFGGMRLTWAQSVRAGFARAFGQDLIPDVRFYAGGEFSLRGYPTEGVGPVETLGSVITPVGGAALLVVNEELRVELPWQLTGVVFVDSGGVWAATGSFGRDLVSSLGLGVRAATPIGLLRFDFALPLDRRPWEPRAKAYVGFGNAF